MVVAEVGSVTVETTHEAAMTGTTSRAAATTIEKKVVASGRAGVAVEAAGSTGREEGEEEVALREGAASTIAVEVSISHMLGYRQN